MALKANPPIREVNFRGPPRSCRWASNIPNSHWNEDFFQQMGNGLWWTLIFPLKTATVHVCQRSREPGIRWRMRDVRIKVQGPVAHGIFFLTGRGSYSKSRNLCFTLPVWETCMYMVRGLNKLSMFASTAPTLSEKTLVFQRSILTCGALAGWPLYLRLENNYISNVRQPFHWNRELEQIGADC